MIFVAQGNSTQRLNSFSFIYTYFIIPRDAEAEEDDVESGEIYPSKVRELQSGEIDAGSARDPRFAMYWMTTTSTSYTTSFTATTSISKLDCTPSGFTMSECG